MKRGLDRELEEDIQFLNDVIASFVQFAVVQEQRFYADEAAIKTLPQAEIDKLTPQARAGLKFVQDHLPLLRKASDWRSVVGVDFGTRLHDIASGEIDAKGVRDLEEFRDELTIVQEDLVGGIVRLTQPAEVLSPSDFIDVIIDSFPEDARDLRKYFRDLKKFLVEMGATNDLATYWQGVAAWASLLGFLSLFLGIIAKWIQYGLDEWYEAQSHGQKLARRPLRRIERFRQWLPVNQPFISLIAPVDLAVRILWR